MDNSVMDKQAVVRSPCIGVCQIDEQQVCMACHRHLDEIAQWPELDSDQRRQVLERIKERQSN